MNGDANQLVQRGMAAHQTGNLVEAERLYREALAVNPNHFEGLHFLGLLLAHRGQPEEGERLVRRSLEVNTSRPEALTNYALVLRGLKRHQDTIAICDKALAIQPRHVDAMVLRANALRDLHRPAEALPWIDRALALAPNYFVALGARGDVLALLGRHDEAIDYSSRAIAINPNYVEGIYNRGCQLLTKGRLEQGWPGYERRYDVPGLGLQRPALPGALWLGEPLQGKSIVIQAEQGFGDTIQFARYLPLVKLQGAQVSFVLRPALWRLLQPLTQGIELLSSVAAGQTFDYHCSLMSLPHRFNTGLSTIPRDLPYLAADADLIAQWRDRIGRHGCKVGICWQGTPAPNDPYSRAVPLAQFAPLARIPGVRLISLQKQHGLDQLAGLPSDATVETLGDDFDSGSDAFVDTAAVMSSLDLVVSADTAVGHVAGGLGRPVWLALSHVADWRWLLDRDDSPWYPTMRLYRQPQRGDWEGVFRRIADDLRRLAGAATTQPR
jgi:tetratricopeptide (TPR) repeat protein